MTFLKEERETHSHTPNLVKQLEILDAYDERNSNIQKHPLDSYVHIRQEKKKPKQ